MQLYARCGAAGLTPPDVSDPEISRATDAYLQLVMETAMGYPIQPAIQAELQVPLGRWAPDSYGTADCVIIGSGRLTVIDYKHGKGSRYPRRATRRSACTPWGVLGLLPPVRHGGRHHRGHPDDLPAPAGQYHPRAHDRA